MKYSFIVALSFAFMAMAVDTAGEQDHSDDAKPSLMESFKGTLSQWREKRDLEKKINIDHDELRTKKQDKYGVFIKRARDAQLEYHRTQASGIRTQAESTEFSPDTLEATREKANTIIATHEKISAGMLITDLN